MEKQNPNEHLNASGDALYFVYIVRCADGTLYTGFSTNIIDRLHAHNTGKGAKYTKGRRPVTLCYMEAYATKTEALQREYKIKQLSRKQKEVLISNKKLAVF
jgi:putative endonuclease